MSEPAIGKSAAITNAADHDPAETVAAKRGGPIIPEAERTVCCSPIAAPLLAAPASSATAVNASPFHAIDRPPEIATLATSSPSGPPASTPGQGDRAGDRKAELTEWRDPRSEDVRPAAGADARCDTENQREADDEGGVGVVEGVLVVQEQDSEADDRHLRVAVERADERKPPDPPIAERAYDRLELELDLVYGSVTQHEATSGRTDSREPREKQERGRRATLGSERRNDDCDKEGAERNRSLSDPERQASLARREPEHDRASARRVHARSSSARQDEQAEQHPERSRIRRADEADSGARETERENETLAVAVGGEPPGKERDARADPRGREKSADLGEREPVLLAKNRRHDTEPDRARGEARLRDRPGRENRPAVAHVTSTARRRGT